MEYFDQHSHCRCSPDSSAPARDMAEAARDHGMSLICFTDHVDMDNSRTGQVEPNWPACWPGTVEEMTALAADPPTGIEIRWGMELGQPNHAPDIAKKAASAPDLDLVLGSFHNLRDTEDFYYIRYTSEEQCLELDRLYLQELREVAEMECFDVMAHVGYTSRYMVRQGFQTQITAENFRDELADIFRLLISRGRGIEVNVSGLRQGHTTYPNTSVLRLYRELGGEIVTVGSDAHTPADAGIGVREGYSLLQSLGFAYVAKFKKRKPEFIRL